MIQRKRSRRSKSRSQFDESKDRVISSNLNNLLGITLKNLLIIKSQRKNQLLSLSLSQKQITISKMQSQRLIAGTSLKKAAFMKKFHTSSEELLKRSSKRNNKNDQKNLNISCKRITMTC